MPRMSQWQNSFAAARRPWRLSVDILQIQLGVPLTFFVAFGLVFAAPSLRFPLFPPEKPFSSEIPLQ